MSQAYDLEHEKLVMKLLEHAPAGVRREHIERAIPSSGEWIRYRQEWEAGFDPAKIHPQEREFAELMRKRIWDRVWTELEVDRRLGMK
jgi:hypothetical protein